MKQLEIDPIHEHAVPEAKYSLFGEKIRQTIPGPMQCSMACGGKRCKWENPHAWSDSEQSIKGVYSTWVLDDVLAMARPSTSTIEKYNMIQQFKDNNICSIINLQTPGEHSSCGPPLEKESLFTYKPQVFMDNDIFFYNFGWKDYGVTSLATLLDMVKVMTFALGEGKVAVHCHAGLGRTGVLIACYLVYAYRLQPSTAILRIRAKRSNSIQTRGQIACIHDFANYLKPLEVVFSQVVPRSRPPTLPEFLTRQKHLLHGLEARELRYMPKLVQIVCERLQQFVRSKTYRNGNKTGEDDEMLLSPMHLRRCNTVAEIKETLVNVFDDHNIPQITLSQMDHNGDTATSNMVIDDDGIIDANETESMISSLHSSSTMSIATLEPSVAYQLKATSPDSLSRSVNDLRDLHKAAQDTKVALLCARGWASDQSLYPEEQSLKVRSLVISQESLTDALSNDLPHSRSTVREFLSANARERKPPTNENNNHVLSRESTFVEPEAIIPVSSTKTDMGNEEAMKVDPSSILCETDQSCKEDKSELPENPKPTLENDDMSNNTTPEANLDNLTEIESHDCSNDDIEQSVLIQVVPTDTEETSNETLFESHLHKINPATSNTSADSNSEEMTVVELEEPNSEFEEEETDTNKPASNNANNCSNMQTNQELAEALTSSPRQQSQTAAFVKVVDTDQMSGSGGGRETPLMYRAEKNLQLLDCDEDDDTADDVITDTKPVNNGDVPSETNQNSTDLMSTDISTHVKDNSLPPNAFQDKETPFLSPSNAIAKCSSLVFDPLPDVARSRSMNDLSTISYPPDLSPLETSSTNHSKPQPPAEYIANALKREEITATDVAQAMAYKLTDDEWLWEKVYTRQVEINTSCHGWDNLCLDTDAYAISALMWSWLEHLSQPVLPESSANEILNVMDQYAHLDQPLVFQKTFEKALLTLEPCRSKTINCLLKCVISFEDVTNSVLEVLVRRMVAALTQQMDCIQTSMNSHSWWDKLLNAFLKYIHCIGSTREHQ